MTTVALVIFHKGRRIEKIFKDDPDSLLAYWNKAKRKYRKSGTFFTVLRSRATAPNEEIPDGMLWCPYCRGARVFELDPRLEVDKCSVCTISTSDYYVRKYNGLDIR